jgi:hypothetical protein
MKAGNQCLQAPQAITRILDALVLKSRTKGAANITTAAQSLHGGRYLSPLYGSPAGLVSML